MLHLVEKFYLEGIMKKQNEKVLILTLSGGGGHLQAARAKHLELLEQGYTTIIQKDTFIDFLGKYLGGLMSGFWNYSQRHGRLYTTLFFSLCSNIFDFLITPIFLCKILFLLKKYQITRVIDTQHIGTKSTIKAIRILKFFTKKTIRYEKVLTDLPTKQCRHYFKSFQKLSTKDKEYIKVITTKPLLEECTDEREFWEKRTGLDLSNIKYDKFPLRPTFNSYEKTNDQLIITFNTYTPEDTLNICSCLAFGDMEFTREKNTLTYTSKNETLSLITLGSYPQKSLLINYMHLFIEQKKKLCPERKEILFLLVGSPKTSAEYYEAIIAELLQIEEYPKNLTIIPLAFQDDTVLAPLYHHIDFIIAKSGGLTTMELLHTVNTNIFIHDSETLKIKGLEFDLMPPWERGNANYLIEKKKAQMINLGLFSLVTSDFFSLSTNVGQLNA